MKRYLFFVYGVVGHLLFLATFVYLAGFIGNFVVPHAIDSGPAGDVGDALLVNALLLGLFAVQHSVMARPAFKQLWTKVIPAPIERSTYVLAASVVTIVLMWQWRPIDTIIWDIQTPALRTVLWCLFACGWLLVPFTTLLISHFDLFGTRQVWLHLRGKEYSSLPFRVPLFYRHVRHPLYLGWTIAFWATPTMTAGHLLFAVGMTSYMAAAAILEERDLVAHFGHRYQEYQHRVPMFVPRLRPQSVVEPESAGVETSIRKNPVLN